MTTDGSIQWPPPGGPMNEQQFEAFWRGDHLRFVDGDGNELAVKHGPSSGMSQSWDGSLTRWSETDTGARHEIVLAPIGRRRIHWTARVLHDDGIEVRTGVAWSQRRAEIRADAALLAIT